MMERNCSLVDEFAIVIQFFLGVAALSSLLYKRRLEVPKRPWKIWFFDASKQAIGQGLVHVVNVVYSSLQISGAGARDPCVWYFLNIMVDTTIGVFFFFILHTLVNEWLIYRLGIEQYCKSGLYGQTPSKPKFSRFLIQLSIFLLLQGANKVIILALIKACESLAYETARFILAPLHNWNLEAETFIVIMVIPLVMNIFQYWLIDYLIMGKLVKKNRRSGDAGYAQLANEVADDVDDSEVEQETNFDETDTNDGEDLPSSPRKDSSLLSPNINKE